MWILVDSIERKGLLEAFSPGVEKLLCRVFGSKNFQLELGTRKALLRPGAECLY